MQRLSELTTESIGETLNLSPELATMALGVVNGSVNPDHFESVARLPENAKLDERKMAAINEIMNGQGVESVNGDRVIATKTVIFRTRDAQFCLGNWGELVKEAKQ